MSTCNFRQPNLSRIYAIGMEARDEWDYEMELDNVKEALRAVKGFKEETGDKWVPDSRDRRILGYFWISFYDDYYREWVEEPVHVTIESGYYAGAMIDIDDSLSERYDINKTTQAKIDRMKRKVERALTGCTLNMRRVAVFSNGEGIYEQIKNSYK